jgi:hypothetical protein
MLHEASFIKKAFAPFSREKPSWPNHLIKGPPLNPIIFPTPEFLGREDQ